MKRTFLLNSKSIIDLSLPTASDEDDLDDDELTTEERAEIIESYQPDIDEIKERIADLKEELEEI